MSAVLPMSGHVPTPGGGPRPAVIVHGARRVTIRVDYVDLAKTAGEPRGLYVRLKTNEGVHRQVWLGAGRGYNWAGEAVMFAGNRELTKVVLRHSIDYETNVARVSFRRRVAGYPDWVNFQIMTMAETRNGASTSTTRCGTAR